MLMGSHPRIARRLAPLLAFGSLAIALVGCGPRFGPDEPVDMVNDACCRVANDDMTKFAGCRPTGRCSKEEAIWMRGYISCSPVEEQRCAGGRCCEYRPMLGSPDAVLHWDDSSGDDEKPPAEEPSTEPTAPTEPVEAEPTDPPPAEPAAEPTPAAPAATSPAAGESMPIAAEPAPAAPESAPKQPSNAA